MTREADAYGIEAYVTDRSAQVIQVESSKIMPLIVVLAMLCGFAIGLSILSIRESAKAERESRVMQERWNDLKVELARRSIPVSDH